MTARTLALTALLLGALAAPASAEDFTVTSPDDAGDGTCDATCTLRDAVDDAGAGDNVILPAGNYAIEAQLNLAADTIVGAGARSTTIDANDESRVLNVTSGANAVSRVTITGGEAPLSNGGGILVLSPATLNVIDSTVVGNFANFGGGIANQGALTVLRSTISDNSAGAPTFEAEGGGIHTTGGSTTLSNSTVSGNRAFSGESAGLGGGVFVTSGTLVARSVTIAANEADLGSAIAFESSGSPTIAISNSIVSGASGSQCFPTPVGGTNNVFTHSSCGSPVGNPVLGGLTNNGGQTDTHALLTGSTAIDAGADCDDPADQRNVQRFGPCDVGAFERATAAAEVNVFTDEVPDGCTPAHCTLRERVVEAVDGEIINLDAGTYQLERGTPLVLDEDVDIAGLGARVTTIDAGGTSRIGTVTANVDVIGITMSGGNANAGTNQQAGNGGAFLITPAGFLAMTQTALRDNRASAAGGAVSNDGTFVFSHSLAAGNIVQGNNPALGGAISSTGQATVLNSTISGNSAEGVNAESRGGGLYSTGSTSIAHATITGNSAEEGAGLYDNTDGDSSIAGSIVAGNVGTECWQATMDDVDEDHNVSDDTSCVFDAEGDRQGVDARLAPLADNGGPTDTHALDDGSPAIDGQDAQRCPSIDQRLIARAAGPCDIGAFERGFVPPTGGGGGNQPPPPPPPPPPPGNTQQELPPPVAGKNVNALPAQGTVKIRLPGTSRFVELEEGQQVPVGTVVDTLNGRVTLVAAGGQTADFYGGIFRIGQGKGSKPLTTLTLIEKLSCPKRGKATAAAKKKKRRLWGDGSGRFRTEGSYSSATVRGTKWLVEDRCSSTLTRVTKGSVSVRDKVKRKTVIVRAGKRYVAKRRGR